MNTITLGVSSCLLGNPVRHDGGHKRNQYVTETLANWFGFRPICPEAAIGLGTPRPALRLVRSEHGSRMVFSKEPDRDISDRMIAWSNNTVDSLKDISGYILKSGSPSCGMERVSLFDQNGVPKKEGVGLFAAALMQAMPWLPIEEEGRLNDPILRENFIQRVFIYHRWQQMMSDGLSVNGLMEFHQRHKLLLMAHHEACYRGLGKLIAEVRRDNLKQVAQQYLLEAMNCMSKRASRKRHTNALMHIMGYLKRDITAHDKQELLDALEKYRTGIVPLVVPLTLLKHYFRLFPDDYINAQHYLSPYPEELMLRNQI